MTETRKFLFVGGPADGQRIELSRVGSGLLGADGKPTSAWPPRHLAKVSRFDIEHQTTITEEGIYNSVAVYAKQDNEDIIRWTVYAHESIREPSEALMQHIFVELWGLM